MAFNKLQGFTLLITFLVICLLNAKSYDFAEEAAVYDAVNEMMEVDMGNEVAVEEATKKVLNFLPKLTTLKDPRILGAIGAVVIASVLGLVYYKTRKISDWPKYVTERLDKRMAKTINAKLPEEEKNKIKIARDTLKSRITAVLADSDFKKHEEKAQDMMKKLYTAQKECGVKVNEAIALFKAMTKNNEVKFDGKVEYMKPLTEAVSKPDTKASAETKAVVATLESDLQNICDDYSTSYKLHKDVEQYLRVLGYSDNDLLTVDFSAKPEDMKKGTKK